MNATIFDRRLKRDAIFLVGFFFVLLAAECFADSESRFLRGLVDRRLFESVEIFCGSTFQGRSPALEEKASSAAELIRSRTMQMLLEEPVRRNELLARILETEKSYANLTNDFSRPDGSSAGIRVRLQTDIAVSMLGDWQRLEADVAAEAERESLLRQARSTLLDALERSSETIETIGRLRQTVGTNATLDLERRLLALERSARFQRALSQRAYAQTFSPGEDRTFGLRRAVEMFAESASLRIDDPIVYQSRIELASGYRLLGETEKSREISAGLREIESRLTPELRFAAQAERLRGRLALGEIDEAAREPDRPPDDSSVPPDFELARLELLVALGHRVRESGKSKSPEIAKRENETVAVATVNLVRKIDLRFGPYWGRRARMILGASSPRDATQTPAESSPSVDPSLLTLLAEDQYQDGRFAEAVRLFEQASRRAEVDGDSEAAFKNAFASVAVLSHVRDRLETSSSASKEERSTCRRRLIDALRNLSKRFFDREESAELHLKGIDLAAEAVLESDFPLDDYLELLKEHADRWPDSVKVPPLLLRAASLLEQQGRTVDALSMLEKIPNASNVGLDAVNAARRCFDAADPRDDSVAARWFEHRLRNTPPLRNEADTLSASNAAEHFIRCAASSTNGDQKLERLKKAESLLRAALECSPVSTLKARLSALLVTTLTEQGRKDEGAEILQTLGTEQLEKLSPAERRAFQEVRIRLLADTGRTQEAVNLSVELLKADPKNLALREQLAEILTRQSDPRVLHRAMQLWIALERDANKDGELWWTARERIIEILLKQGKTEEAQKSFDVLRLLHPDLGGEARKVRLEKKFAPRIHD